jgi:hypothetical protein
VNHFRRKGREKVSDDPGGIGRETAKELVVCPVCAERSSERDHPDQRLRGPPVRSLAA